MALVVAGVVFLAVVRHPAHADMAGSGPTVTGCYPANGATGVPRKNTRITANFSEAMDVGSISGTSFIVVGVNGTVSYDDDSHGATFSPAEDLADNATYFVSISSGVRNVHGRSMGDDFTWTFSTGSSVSASSTIIGNGRYPFDGRSEPRDQVIGAATTAYLDAFDLSTTGGTTDTISAVTVQASPPGISRSAIARVEITDHAGTVKGTLDKPATDTWTIPVAGVTTDSSQWLVRVTTADALPASAQRLTGTVSSVTGTLGNQVRTQDTSSATLTIDGTKPIPATTTGTFTFLAVNGDTVIIQISFEGDSPEYVANNSCTLTWGVDPGAPTGTARLSRTDSTYKGIITGLLPDTTYFFAATFTDPDGVEGVNPILGIQKTTR
jgi:hypothetical protein